ncbi:hypothetical protein SAMN05444678_102272 [Sphingomonas sp. YR710]|uniref:hypothetical protein n=1 Tax=Sphingomonas sp. YR710 TaxID=1882773 RepID=UPI0008811E4F|nr:hypothetical protein [Sphingomonas sp. YR710]SDC31223.1 hypothetical protein SAMN05444678_102272 [Sphingomonas sp. YR710]
MSKIVKPLLIVAAIAVNVIPGAGQAVSASIFGAIAGSVGLAAAATIASLAPLALTVAGLAAASSLLSPKMPQSPLGQLDRLNASVNPNAFRTMVLGQTAMGTDIRYVEPSGTDQEYIDYIIGVACHKVTSIDEIWFEQRLAWSAGGGVDSFYAGYLSIDTVLEGNASNTIAINGGGTWGSNARLTGCAYVHVRLKRTGSSSKATSPLASGLPSRVTIIGKGMPLYDPRRDSTVPGGSGSMRADDQSTWSFAPGGTEIGNNLALQILNYHLGWRIEGELSVGPGLPKERLNMPSFIVAANLCDEAVTKADSSTEPRYHGGAVVTEGNQPGQVHSVLVAACNGRLRDNGGKLSLAIMHNDLAVIDADDGLTDVDVLPGGYTWDPFPTVSENIVRGKYTDPSPNSLYQPIDYPEVKLSSLDGIDRVLTLDLLAVESPSQGERIAKQVLERHQYPGTFSAVFSNRAWKYQIGDPLPLTFSGCAFVRKKFRVADQTITYDGTCPMVLTEENDAIYAWDASETAPVTAAAPITFDPRNAPYVLGIEDARLSAADAASAAATAEADATTALTEIGTIVADNVLDRSEKPAIVADYGVLTSEQSGIDAQATAYAITTEQTAYDSAITSLGVYLAALSPAYNDYTADTAIVRSVFISTFQAAYAARQTLLNKIAAIAGTVSTWGGVSSRPTELTDGRIPAALDSSGVVNPDKVKTLSIEDASVTIRAGVEQVGTEAGSGSLVTILTFTLVLPYDGMVIIQAVGSQNYYSGIPDWEAHINIGGSPIAGASGGAGDYQSIVAMAGIASLSAGTYTIDMTWKGGTSAIVLSEAALIIDASMK